MFFSALNYVYSSELVTNSKLVLIASELADYIGTYIYGDQGKWWKNSRND